MVNFLPEKLGRLKSFFKPKYWVPMAAVGLILLIVLSSFYPLLNRQSGLGNNLFAGFSKLVISPAYANDNFTITPSISDSLGVSPDSDYILKSKEPVNTKLIKENLKVEPNIDYNLHQVSDTEWKIDLKNNPPTDTLVKFVLATSYEAEGQAKESDYSWVFQVKNSFKILNSLPRHQSTNVPLNTGIEIMFSHDNFTEWEKYFSISPTVAGTFEKHSRTLVFVPKELLKEKTIYTVTLKPELTLADSNEKLIEEYQFSFETESRLKNQYDNNYFNVARQFYEVSPQDKPLIQIFSDSESLGVKVFQYSNSGQFLTILKKMDSFPAWSSARLDYLADTNGLNQVLSFEAVAKEENYTRYLEFPTILNKGFYLVELTNKNITRQVYLQVTDLLAYINATKSDTLVWINNLTTKQPVAGAKVSVLDTKSEAVTDGQGVARLATAENFYLDKKTNDWADVYFKLQKDNDTLFVRNGGGGYYDSRYGNSADYWKYLYTDRPMYQPTDVIKYWGMLQERKSLPINEPIKVTLFKEGYVDYYYQPVKISEQNITLNSAGTFSGELKINNLRADYYTLQLTVGEAIIFTRSISVQDYIKPAYELTLNVNKMAVYANEPINFKAKAAFFEGTPVPALKLAVNLPNGEVKNLTTDDLGEINFTYIEPMKTCESGSVCWPKFDYVNVRPEDSELADISAELYVKVYGPNVYLTQDIKYPAPGQAEVKFNAYKIDLNALNSDDYYNSYP